MRRIVWMLVLLAATAAHAAEPATTRAADHLLVYVGTTGGATPIERQGVFVATFDPAEGKLSEAKLAAAVPGPSFVAIHPSGKFLYAARNPGQTPSAVAAYAIDRPSGKLTEINRQSSGGGGACFVAVDDSGRDVLVAYYGSGSVAVLPIAEDGSLKAATAVVQDKGSGPDANRQKGPHAHSFNVDPTNRFAISCDLGTDEVQVYQFDAAKGTLVANDPPGAKVSPGGGPRHLAWGREGKVAYVISEMGNAVTAYSWDATRGTLKELQTVPTLPAEYKEPDTAAEVVVHPNGKWLYASNRGHNSVARFDIAGDGKLTSRGQTPCGGNWPRNIAIEPGGKWLLVANEKSGEVVVFAIDGQTGELRETAAKAAVPTASCVRFVTADDRG